MLSIKDNLIKINKSIKEAADRSNRDHEDIQLIAVSKRKSETLILDAIHAGAEFFGENYIQEAMGKIDSIGKEKACWHFIGHLQSNKAKYAVKYFDFIHTVDSIKLAKEINKHAQKINKTQNILIQINISDELTKSGTTIDNVFEIVDALNPLENISLQGLMCMPPFFDDPEYTRPYFKELAELQQTINQKKIYHSELNHLSMGMSNDFEVAIEEGATMVRVGTSIFGARV